MVKDLMTQITPEYTKYMKEQTDKEYTVELVLDTSFLTAEETGEAGGLILMSADKRIVCNNTLESRLS